MGQPSYSGVFDNCWHGAFTWALITVLGQRPIALSEEGRFFEIDYQSLIQHIRTFLDVLQIPQKPGLWAPAGNGLPRLQWPTFGFPTWRPQISLVPARLAAEIDAGADGCIYEARQNNARIGWFIVAISAFDVSGIQFLGGREYWYLNSGRFPSQDFELVPLYERNGKNFVALQSGGSATQIASTFTVEVQGKTPLFQCVRGSFSQKTVKSCAFTGAGFELQTSGTTIGYMQDGLAAKTKTLKWFSTSSKPYLGNGRKIISFKRKATLWTSKTPPTGRHVTDTYSRP